MVNEPVPFQGHPVIEAIDRLQEFIDARQGDNRPQEAQEEYRRLSYLVSICRRYLNEADPIAVLRTKLDAAKTQASQALTYLQQAENGPPQVKVKAAAAVENVLINLAALPRLSLTEDGQNPRELIAVLAEAIASRSRELDESANQFSSRIAELESGLNPIVEKAGKIDTRFDDAIGRFEQQFSTSEEQRRKDFQKATKEHDRQVASFIQQADARLDAAQEAFASAADSHLEEINTRKKEAEKVVGAIAETVMAGGYKQAADDERQAMRFWRGIAVVAMVGSVLLLFAFLPVSADVSWPEFARRAIAALAVGGLATYAGRIAFRHAEQARYNRRMELEIASLGPFLATLPKEDQDAIRKAIADRIFGQLDNAARAVRVGDSDLANMPTIKVVDAQAGRR